MAKSRSARRPARRYSFACVSDHTDEVDDTNAFATCGLDVRGDRFGDEGRRRLTGRRERFARAYKDAYLSSKTSRARYPSLRSTSSGARLARCGSRRAGPVWHAVRACGPRLDRPRTEAGPRREGKRHMPAGITSSDSMFSVRETPWHGLGAVLDRPPATIAEAIQASGLGVAGGARADRGRPG